MMSDASIASSTNELVSVIVPAHNYGHFIARTLRSVQAQTHRHWECIVVDDASTDDTSQVVQSLARQDGRIRYLPQPRRSHQAAAKNAGLRASRGQFIQFLDADDLLESRKFELQIAFLRRHPEVDIVYGQARYFRSDWPLERRFSMRADDRPWMPMISGTGNELLRELIERNILAINCALVRRSALTQIDGFDQSLRRLDDWDLWIRCAAAGLRFACTDLPETMALVRIHPASLTQGRHDMVLESSLAIHRKLQSSLGDPELRAINHRTIQWLTGLCAIDRWMRQHIAAGEAALLADEGKLRDELLDHTIVPFTEHAGQYWGPPADDEAAIRELRRHRAAGVRWLLIAWPAMWYLEHYHRFAEHLGFRYPCVCRDQHLVAYALDR
ncbi:glycosyltransferase family 2 protein [Fontivita pretiosa]|uniref:glycosyltransferase family 2 protein n=1 Tax=Fontivita pretiosa TaxID=2989684 RepID=UPI003D165F18